MSEILNVSKEEKENRTINLNALLMSFLSKWWLILACILVGVTLAFVYTVNFQKPLYRSSVSMYVNNVRNNAQVDIVTTANLSAAQTLVSTYQEIITSDSMFERVIAKNEDKWEDRVTVSQLKGMVSTRQVNDTGIFNLYVSSRSPVVAQEVANAMADTIVETMGDIVEGSSVKVIDYAKKPTKPYLPSYPKNMLFGGALGAVAVMAVLTLLFLFDTKIHSADELEQMFKLPVLGNIPEFNAVTDTHSYTQRS